MQSIWSRAAGQAHLCGCRGCIQVAGGMTRQSTTRAVRRKVTFGEVFTAFYTSIMGTAAIVDAKFKDDRRKEINRQIEEVKADLERLSHSAPLALPDPTAEPPSGDIHNRYKGCWKDDVRQQRGIAEFFDTLGEASTWKKPSMRSTELDNMWTSLGLPPLEAGIAKRKKTDYDMLQWELEKEEGDSSIAHRLPRTEGQLRGHERSTKSLVMQLLRAVDLPHLAKGGDLRHILKWLENNQSTDFRPELQRRLNEIEDQEQDPARRRLRRVVAEDYPHYSATAMSRGKHSLAEATRELNESIRIILTDPNSKPRSTPEDDTRDRIVKLCYNLLISPSPPTVHTLSTLLLGFDRIGQHEVANKVAVHLLYHTKLEPTQQTLICLFNHYKELGNMARFGQLIQRCTALDPKPLKFRRKRLDDVLEDEHLQRWAQTKDVIAHGGTLYERAWFSNALVNTILQGLLSFDCLEQAVQTFTFCWERGIRICTETVMQMLDQCMHALDEEVAFKILRAFFDNQQNILLGFGDYDRDLVLIKLQRLLDLCGVEASAAQVLARDRAVTVEATSSREVRPQSLRLLSVKRDLDMSQGVIEDLRASLETPEVSGDEAEELPRGPIGIASQLVPRRIPVASAMVGNSLRGPPRVLSPLEYGAFERASSAPYGRLSSAYP